jgi:predicted PurR-regulated permease PerM
VPDPGAPSSTGAVAGQPCPAQAPRLALWILAGVALLAALYLGRAILLPLATALLFSLVLRPLTRRLQRLRVPMPLAAFLLVGILAGALTSAIYGLSDPARQWLEQAPQSLRQLQYRIIEFKGPIEDMQAATEQVEQLGSVGDDPKQVVVERNDLPGRILVEMQQATTGVLVTLVLLFFILGWGGRLYAHVVAVMPSPRSRDRFVSVLGEIERTVSRYLVTITVINGLLGAAVALLLHQLGMPNPVLWGVMTAVLNFIPYLGPGITALVLGFVALIHYPTVGEAAVVPLAFLALTSLEGYVLTPMAVGSRLRLNPLIIIVSLVFWFWIWGFIGGLLTVPMLACLKIVLQHTGARALARVLD